MNLVLGLTKAGRLHEATRSIQKALRHDASPAEIRVDLETDHRLRPLRPLGEVVAKLGKMTPKLQRNTKSPKLTIPAGAKFLDGSFTCAAGARTYKLYVPSYSPVHPRGLIVMLHGCTQNSADFAAGTRMNDLAEIEGMLVVYPNQTTHANSSGCWNWFNPRDQNHGQGEPSIIAGITTEVMATYNIDPHQVFIAGLSAGGAMAVVMGHTYPNLYSAVGVHSGLPYQSANDVISAFAAMRGEIRNHSPQLKPRVIVFHGDADKTVHPSNALAMMNSDNRRAAETIEGVSVGGIKYTRTIIEDQNKTPLSEVWLMHGAGHAWSGGSPAGSYTDSKGPDASKEIMKFFLKRRES